ncbi:hypothetical protein COY93_00835 [Candidatus Uhrbacteria bacterium CG_4_10_14_0_8_um_filter_58_22]|uniref:Uncharacterized protein n=1 Tax=Candidatus Uhrbacteria bacterium CG_4_10_14_0_8_um_filter_58_22 TaxID=1975029 RepID=A0A2M7QC15_9BACT|nr:MAG: hypothetical protein AUJ19_00670 [Parcubacteria group bacterium CG1_02_58_44]PIY63331.1 MAG: hypothetical protein COY93_00835 [Candidatus Uhrbacteria bacterium CG_4_10_14_0_8_um_filter_58_22]
MNERWRDYGWSELKPALRLSVLGWPIILDCWDNGVPVDQELAQLTGQSLSLFQNDANKPMLLAGIILDEGIERTLAVFFVEGHKGERRQAYLSLIGTRKVQAVKKWAEVRLAQRDEQTAENEAAAEAVLVVLRERGLDIETSRSVLRLAVGRLGLA